jgi:hypothetical protein
MFAKLCHASYRFGSGTRFWLGRHFTRAGLIVLAGVALTASRFDTNLSVGYQAFTLLASILIISLIAARWGRGRFELHRALPRMGSVGAPLRYELRLKNLSRREFRDLTLWEQLSDPRPSLSEFISSPEPGEEKRPIPDRYSGFYRWRWLVNRKRMAAVPEQPLARLAGGENLALSMQILPRKRGWLRFQGLAIGCPDLFGLFRSLAWIPANDSILILPKRYALPPLAMPGARKYQLGGIAMAASVGESDEFVALRDFRPGDPLRRIHWRSWAKSGKPIVKEYQDEYFVRHALILDTFCEHAYSDMFEEAVAIAASFACALQTQDSLLDLLFAGPKAYCFTIGRGLAHTEQLLEILAAIEPCRDQPFARLHELAITHSPLVSGIVIILMSWDEARQRLVQQLHQLRIPLRVLMLQEPGANAPLDPGPLRDEPESFLVLPLDKIAEKLAALT